MKRTFVIVLSALLCLAIVTPASAAFDYFLRLDGIDGTSTIKGYEKWIEVESYQLGVTNTATTGGGSGGATSKIVFEDFSFTKLLDAASPGIFEHLVTAKHIKSGQFDILQSGDKAPQKVFSYSFTDVLLTNLNQSGAAPDLPTESVAFRFGTIKLQSYLQDPKGGSVKPGPSFEYDVNAAAAIPEPSTWLTLTAGLVILVGGSRVARRRLQSDGRPG